MAALNHKKILKMGRYSDLSLEGMDVRVVRQLHRFMLRLRRCEEALMEEYHPADEIRCPVHFCVGQEAVPAALSQLITPGSHVFSHHRSHGYFLAKGGSMRSLFAELYGRTAGANGGIAGSQDISEPSVNFHSGAILSGAVAIAAGTSLGLQLQQNPCFAVAGFGDGATDEGVFWETINYAALRKLPLVLLCENNGYATYSNQLKRQPSDNISDRVAAFGLRTHALFGNDVVAVYKVIDEAIRHAVSGKGPFFIEAYTYRRYGHVGPESDDHIGYRSEEEVNFWKTHCPIALLEQQMISNGILNSDQKRKVIGEIDAEINDAFKFARNSPFPTAGDWQELNYHTGTPLADDLLRDTEMSEFDQSQLESIPEPY